MYCSVPATVRQETELNALHTAEEKEQRRFPVEDRRVPKLDLPWDTQRVVQPRHVNLLDPEVAPCGDRVDR